jgi:DNA-binding response OmpR family regulator
MSPSLSVLIVEDHDPLRHSLGEFLTQRGFRVHAAEEGTVALDFARRLSPDFSILDLHLPGLTGLELFQTMRREIGPIPSIMMSGEATELETEMALKAGVFSFLRKPLVLDQLQRSLDRLIQTHFPHRPGQAYGPPGP